MSRGVAGEQAGSTMTIHVDADGLPKRYREILVRVGVRRRGRVVFYSDRPIATPAGSPIEGVVVETGPEAVDDEIASRVAPDDLVVTRDVALGARCVAAGATVIGFAGETLTGENARERLSIRNLGRALGRDDRPSPTGHHRKPRDVEREVSAFAAALDRAIAGAR